MPKPKHGFRKHGEHYYKDCEFVQLVLCGGSEGGFLPLIRFPFVNPMSNEDGDLWLPWVKDVDEGIGLLDAWYAEHLGDKTKQDVFFARVADHVAPLAKKA